MSTQCQGQSVALPATLASRKIRCWRRTQSKSSGKWWGQARRCGLRPLWQRNDLQRPVCGKVTHAIIFVYLPRAFAMGRSTGSNGLCAGRASDLHKAQKEPTETSHSHFPCSGLTRNGEYLSGFKNPVAFPIFIDLVPPAEAHHEPSGYILRKADNMTHNTPQIRRWSSPFYRGIKVTNSG